MRETSTARSQQRFEHKNKPATPLEMISILVTQNSRVGVSVNRVLKASPHQKNDDSEPFFCTFSCSSITTLLHCNSYTKTSRVVNHLNRMETRHTRGEIRSCGFHLWTIWTESPNPHQFQRKAQTHLDGVIPQAADDLLVVVLQAVNTLAVLRPALDPLQVVSAAPPVRLDGLRTAMEGLKSKLLVHHDPFNKQLLRCNEFT